MQRSCRILYVYGYARPSAVATVVVKEKLPRHRAQDRHRCSRVKWINKCKKKKKKYRKSRWSWRIYNIIRVVRARWEGRHRAREPCCIYYIRIGYSIVRFLYTYNVVLYCRPRFRRTLLLIFGPSRPPPPLDTPAFTWIPPFSHTATNLLLGVFFVRSQPSTETPL